MREVAGKVAFITGAASGIGLGIARTLAAAGARVALADIRSEAVQAAAAALGREGLSALAVTLDVADRPGWTRAVEQVERSLGPIRILCSNAGVNFVGATHEATSEDWDFALGVNLGGAINAIRTVIPRMIAGGAGGHVVITSSVSGLFSNGGAGVYTTTKFALVGLAESLRADLRSSAIGVSVLCPGPVKSELFESTVAVRPRALAATGSVPIIGPGVKREDTPIFTTAPSGDDIGLHVLRGIRENRLYILTHPEMRPVLEARCRAILAALPNEPVDPRRIEASAPLLDASLYEES